LAIRCNIGGSAMPTARSDRTTSPPKSDDACASRNQKAFEEQRMLA